MVSNFCSASIVQWLEFVPSKHEVRVRFPVDADKKKKKKKTERQNGKAFPTGDLLLFR